MDYGRAVRTKYDEKRNSYHQEEREAMELDIFLRDENIRRYRRLLDSSTGKTERGTIFKLLAEEMQKIKGEHPVSPTR